MLTHMLTAFYGGAMMRQNELNQLYKKVMYKYLHPDCTDDDLYDHYDEITDETLNKTFPISERSWGKARTLACELGVKYDSPIEKGADWKTSFFKDIESGVYWKTPTGIAAYDKVTGGGLRNTSLNFLAAPPANCKSAVAYIVGENWAMEGRNVFYFSLEMDKSELFARGLTRYIYTHHRRKISADSILDQRLLKAADKKLIMDAFDEYDAALGKRYNLIRPETSYVNEMFDYYGVFDGFKSKDTFDRPLVILDYTQKADIEGYANSEQEYLQQINNYLTLTARKYGTCILGLSAQSRSTNLSQGSNNKRKSKQAMADGTAGRGSSSFEYDADKAVILKLEGNKLTFVCGKNRQGEKHKGEAYMIFDGTTMTLYEYRISPDDEDPNDVISEMFKNPPKPVV